MKFTKVLATLPKPLRLAGVCFITVFALSTLYLSVLSSGPRAQVEVVSPWIFAAIGAASLTLGLILALDYQGSASAYANLGKAYRGESFWKPSLIRRFVRIFGAGMALIGVCFVVFPLLYLVTRP